MARVLRRPPSSAMQPIRKAVQIVRKTDHESS
jgi:hypothetical protein